MTTSSPNSLRTRLLQDIKELQENPYPNIVLHVNDKDMTWACLILTAEGYGPLHLTVEFPPTYPLLPPRVKMDSKIEHPNIFGGYICASILNTQDGYTPAYTMKAIAIQLLSFFSSNEIEQTGGGYSVNLDEYRQYQRLRKDDYICNKCHLDKPQPSANYPIGGDRLGRNHVKKEASAPGQQVSLKSLSGVVGNLKICGRRKKENDSHQAPDDNTGSSNTDGMEQPVKGKPINKLPNELILPVCELLEIEDMMAFAEAWPKVGRVITNFDVIRTRELQCFCLKKDYKSTKLGVGVSIGSKGIIKSLASEFDLLSEEGFKTHHIRRSVQGLPFQHWLPLPISLGHWKKVRQDVSKALADISLAANMASCSGRVVTVQVIYSFMNSVVVNLNDNPAKRTYFNEEAKSTLTHASEKAIESYFHLFHMLLCLANEDPSIVQSANKSLNDFVAGKTSKADCPNLGYLLISALISDVEMTPTILRAITKEAITRNVVWMLGSMPELSYMEPCTESSYRVKRSFEASRTSYRLLMFLNLFRGTAVGQKHDKTLAVLCDEAFERHGAPPRGSAKELADSIKRIHQIDSFPKFMVSMGIQVPSLAYLTKLLKECIDDSIKKGYSIMPISQGQALTLRQEKEGPNVEVAEGVFPMKVRFLSERAFFPNAGPRPSHPVSRGRGGGRGNWRGN